MLWGTLSGTGRVRKSAFASVLAMPPTVKENEILTARPETAQRPAPAITSPGDSGVKQQAVALEVPVTVNGARTIEGGDKREPFSETTKTVLVFGNGAVIRLASAVAPGQLLFLTNEKTKKEVVCQVVKSKNYRNVSGYVELEFTESVVGFWGMRFPGDRIGSGPQPVAAPPVATSSSLASGSPALPRPVVPRVEAPAANVAPSIVVPKPAVPVVRDVEPKLAESKFVIPEAPQTPIPAASKVEEPFGQKPVAPVSPLSSTLSTSFDPAAPLSLPSTTPLPPAAPVVPIAPVNAIPEVPVTPAPAKVPATESVLFDAPRVSEAQASFLEPAKMPSTQLTASAPNLLSLFEAKPVAPLSVAPPPPAPPSLDPETEALKQHTARLQEQLSSMLFSGAPAPPATVSVQIPHVPPVVIQKELAENAAKILEMSHISTPEPVPAKPVEPVKFDSPPVKSSLADEELKIPAWLEPLARNAAAPSSTQELLEREKAKRLAEQPIVEQTAAEIAAVVEEQHIPELSLPTFGDSLLLDEEKNTGESGSKSSSKGIWIAAIAAGVLVVAGGGWWYMQQQSAGVHAGTAPAPSVQASVLSAPGSSSSIQPQGNAVPTTNPPAQTNPAALTNTSATSNSASNTLSVVPAVSTASSARNSQPSSNPANGSAGASTSVPAAIEQPKKPMLGDIHLAAPKLSPNRSTQNSAEPDAGIALTNDDQPDPGAEALNAGLVGGNKQPSAPAAPLPVGGDVKQAKLISSVPPQYPALAKNQHVSGNVLVDALIDANGRVTTMKVVSGPTLLHQAAMDSLKQWKYQPASLDGKPVSMHLTVTIQFRLQ
jgi:TonB family protein